MHPSLDLPTGKLQYGPYSPSRLETGICGHAFHKTYVEKDRRRRQSEDGLAAARGSVVHEVFEEMNAQLLQGKYAFMPKDISSWIAKYTNKYPEAYKDISTIRQCVELYANNPPQNLPEDAEIEMAIALDADMKECGYDDPNAMIRGRADLLWFDDDLDVHILDYKTQPNMDLDGADTFQMGVYALVMARKYNLKQAYTSIYFARYGKYSREYLWTEEELNSIERQLIDRINSIENRTEWVAVSHNGCQYCPFRTECPLYEGVFEVEEFGVAEEGTGMYKVNVIDPDIFNVHGDLYRAQSLASVMMQLEELLSLGKGNVRDFVKTYGQPVASGNQAYMYKPKEDFDWTYINKNTKAAVFDIMAKHGVDGRKYAGFSKKFMNAVFLLENKEEMFEELREHLPRKVTTTFSKYKI